MNISNFKSICFALIFALSATETIHAESLTSDDHYTWGDTRQHRGYEGWSRLIPTHVKAQYAGGLGVAAVGCGWDYGKKCRWESDIMLGILPKCYADKTHVTFSLKQSYIPWSLLLYRGFTIEPFTTALTLNFISGSRFWIKEPNRYPGNGYYNFSSGMRLYLSFGQRFTYAFRRDNTLQSISLYYEFSACDLDIIAAATNRQLAIDDIFHFSVGVKFQLFRNPKVRTTTKS